MKICPIAVVAGCAKCPVVKICPLKGVLGDAKLVPPTPEPKTAAKPRKRATRKTK